jgi:alkylated DNA repair dioxygenase AlkB
MSEMLFPTELRLPPGFLYVQRFLTPEEETSIRAAIAGIELHAFKFQGFEAKRRVASFGYDYSFEKGSLSAGKVIPAVFRPLITKVARHISIDPDDFKELLVTEYPVGAVINWHRDAPPFDIIAGVSLASACRFRLRSHDTMKQGKRSILSINLERGSLYIMQGEARTDWQHSIAPVDKTRYSITLRTLRATSNDKA